MRAGEANLMNIKFKSVQDKKLGLFNDAKVNLHGASEGASREIKLEMKIIVLWDCKFR